MFMNPFYMECKRPRVPICPKHLMGFGIGPTPQDFLFLTMPEANEHCQRPWRHPAAAQGMGATIKGDKDKFQVNLDVQHFAPEEIAVKAANGFLIVEAKHEEREDDHGFVSRSFTRKYALPEGVEADLITSKLSSDGVLTVTAPLKASPNTEIKRVVPIIQTGPVRKQVHGMDVEG